jgi:hypothetical protein
VLDDFFDGDGGAGSNTDGVIFEAALVGKSWSLRGLEVLEDVEVDADIELDDSWKSALGSMVVIDPWLPCLFVGRGARRVVFLAGEGEVARRRSNSAESRSRCVAESAGEPGTVSIPLALPSVVEASPLTLRLASAIAASTEETELGARLMVLVLLRSSPATEDDVSSSWIDDRSERDFIGLFGLPLATNRDAKVLAASSSLSAMGREVRGAFLDEAFFLGLWLDVEVLV